MLYICVVHVVILRKTTKTIEAQCWSSNVSEGRAGMEWQKNNHIREKNEMTRKKETGQDKVQNKKFKLILLLCTGSMKKYTNNKYNK